MFILVIFGGFVLFNFIRIGYRYYKETKMTIEEEERERRARALQEHQERELQETVRQYLRSGKKIDAIKECKDFYDCSLSKAKTIVSEIEFEMSYEREHSEDYRPYAHGHAHRIEPTSQSVNSTFSCASGIDGMEGHKFEHFCADLLLKTAFDKADVTPGSGDQGVDIVAVKDGVKYAIQCKNYASPLSNTPVQEVNAGKTFYGCHVGVVMTNSTFTSGARKLADATGVLLWDRAYVEKLMEKAGIQNIQFQNDQSGESAVGAEKKHTDNIEVNQPLQDADSFTDNIVANEARTSELCVTNTQQEGESDAISNGEPSSLKMRTGMKALMIFSLIYVVVSVLAGIGTEQLDMAVGMGGFFGILAIMFFALAKSSKHSPSVYIRNRTIKKSKFVMLSVIAAFAFVVVVIIISGTV